MVVRFLRAIHTGYNKGGPIELPTSDLVLGGAGKNGSRDFVDITFSVVSPGNYKAPPVPLLFELIG